MNDEARALLRTASLFRDLPGDELDGLAAVATWRAYTREQVIFAPGDPAESLFVLVAGYVRLYQLPEAKELTVAILSPGECFGLAGLGEDRARQHFAQGLTAVRCLSIPLTAVLARFGRHAALAWRLLTHLGTVIGRREDLAASLAFRPVHARLAQMLLRLREQEHRDGQLPLHLTQADLASMIATSREQVSEALTEFEAAGYIVKQHGHVVAVCDPAGLCRVLAAPSPDQPLRSPALPA